MRIGDLVRHYIPFILEYCEKHDHSEFYRLCDRAYSTDTLDVNFPFCKPVAEISALENRRFWSQVYVVSGISVRVISQWYDPPISKSRPSLVQYQERCGIEMIDAARVVAGAESAEDMPVERAPRAARSRFKGNAIGNAQNPLVRNILSNLGMESFGQNHWLQVIDAFGGCCAYCGQEGDVVMDHVVPINKQSLGEHRLGNIVPCCRACNDRLVFDGNFGFDVVTDFSAGVGEGDVLQLSLGSACDSYAEVMAVASQVNADTVFDFGGLGSITLQGVSMAALNPDDFLFAA
ncbi:HNH endonuclease signature motif containing protein [Aestuariivirga sp.]|uniref:HNH endonuclease n=1 Tax=Aestuariivirga sp. TaxID=2650926 RepID=UPI0025C3A173|nr:HNH endonuclease signature motif containing protein [Aestuariivirga sp.]MCA3554186.1 HNH endonuclease [Aestuariivirga sp.]